MRLRESWSTEDAADYWRSAAAQFQSMDIQVVVPVSGGKDSQACLKLALQEYSTDQIIGLFCDTQFEHPLTYAHVDNIETLYQVHIERLCAGSVDERVRRYKRFPGGGARHCTKDLKITPSKKFYLWLAATLGRGFTVWYGMRGSESTERRDRYEFTASAESYPPHEVLGNYPKKLFKAGVMFRLPIVEWTTDQVMQFLGGEANPLYAKGFDRVGCFPCLAGGDKSKIKAFEFDLTGAKHLNIVRQIEKDCGIVSLRTNLGKKWEDEQGGGCSFCSI
jgi:3'-phosphoadenosine 5'-phosphosulfate sulfotransferase (PAPS reductase)/FAD synthetase